MHASVRPFVNLHYTITRGTAPVSVIKSLRSLSSVLIKVRSPRLPSRFSILLGLPVGFTTLIFNK